MRCTRITWMGTRLSRVCTRFMALRIADLYYVILLMWNESFRNLAGEVKALLLSYCDIFMNPDNFLSDEQIEVLTQRYNRMNTIMDDRRKVIDGISDLLLQQYNTLGITAETATNPIDQMVLSQNGVAAVCDP